MAKNHKGAEDELLHLTGASHDSSLEILNDNGVDQDVEPYETSLDKRVLDSISKCPDYKIKPAILASDVGISIEDANAELCGLLQAVGPTATFQFETIKNEEAKDTVVMVFRFPSDFRSKAYAFRRKESVKAVLCNIASLLWKIVKVVIAFGLILSLAILLIGALCAMIAAIVAMSRGGNDRHHTQRLMRQMRSMSNLLRQLLWCYAIFGEGLDHGQDPFLREVAHTMALGMNVLMGTPGSIWWWISMRRFRERQQNQRGWGATRNRESVSSWSNNRSSWRQQLADIRSERSQAYDENERGILSVAVEFLFGPTQSGPSEFQKWKMREVAIVSTATRSQGERVRVLDLLPYVDNPPDMKTFYKDPSHCGSTECLGIITHFNGIPCGIVDRHFIFPELMQQCGSLQSSFEEFSNLEDMSGSHSFFFLPHDEYLNLGNDVSRKELPPYLYESTLCLTKLSQQQFVQCCVLNLLNYIGILMLRSSVVKGGSLEIKNANLLNAILMLFHLLEFYAKLFFALPIGRGIYLSILNFQRKLRNQRRKFYAERRNEEDIRET